jgi:hypothetical protein
MVFLILFHYSFDSRRRMSFFLTRLQREIYPRKARRIPLKKPRKPPIVEEDDGWEYDSADEELPEKQTDYKDLVNELEKIAPEEVKNLPSILDKINPKTPGYKELRVELEKIAASDKPFKYKPMPRKTSPIDPNPGKTSPPSIEPEIVEVISKQDVGKIFEERDVKADKKGKLIFKGKTINQLKFIEFARFVIENRDLFPKNLTKKYTRLRPPNRVNVKSFVEKSIKPPKVPHKVPHKASKVPQVPHKVPQTSKVTHKAAKLPHKVPQTSKVPHKAPKVPQTRKVSEMRGSARASRITM